MRLIGICLLLTTLFSSKAHAWGNRGHTLVCEASIYLVKDKNLKSFLLKKSQMLNHLCLVPDIFWRGLYPQSMIGNSTHYINHEKLNVSIGLVPLKYQDALAKLPKSLSMKEKAKELGSNWWRAEQFFRRAISEGKKKSAENFLINVGLMGHFVADNGVPFHVTEDFDGRKIGHSGLHDFYETHVPSLLGPEALEKIVASARNEKLGNADILLSMRQLASEAFKDVKFLIKTDPVKEKSFSKKSAIRHLDGSILLLWEPIIVKAMGRSAALLAHSIEEAYNRSGKPLFGESYFPFPLTPDYVEPDFFTP